MRSCFIDNRVIPNKIVKVKLTCVDHLLCASIKYLHLFLMLYSYRRYFVTAYVIVTGIMVIIPLADSFHSTCSRKVYIYLNLRHPLKRQVKLHARTILTKLHVTINNVNRNIMGYTLNIKILFSKCSCDVGHKTVRE